MHDRLTNSGKSFNLSYSFQSFILLFVIYKIYNFTQGYKLSNFSI